MMNCILNTNEQEELLLGYCSATLDAETARTFSRHLNTCQDCRELVDLHKILDQSLVDWQAPEVSSDFDQKLFARIRLEESKPQPWWQFFAKLEFGWKPLIPLAALVAIFAVFLSRTPQVIDTAQGGDSIKADEIELVERALDDMEALQLLHPTNPAQASKESL